MSKQYIKASNEAPTPSIPAIVIYAMAIKVFHLPEFMWGIWGTLTVLLLIIFIYRISTETGVDVVERKDD